MTCLYTCLPPRLSATLLMTCALLLTLDSAAASYAKIFKKVDPSVVVIHTREQMVTESGAGVTRTAQGIGSGVIISKEGLIMTAAHVVQVSDKIAVELTDGKKYPAHVVASAAISAMTSALFQSSPTSVFASSGSAAESRSKMASFPALSITTAS